VAFSLTLQELHLTGIFRAARNRGTVNRRLSTVNYPSVNCHSQPGSLRLR
jgi:hypothetical protein